MTEAEISAIYAKLREICVDGTMPIGGQSTLGCRMAVLNFSDFPSGELVSLVYVAQGGAYNAC